MKGCRSCKNWVAIEEYLDRDDPAVVNAKVQRPGVCNALETLLVHRDCAGTFSKHPRSDDALPPVALDRISPTTGAGSTPLTLARCAAQRCCGATGGNQHTTHHTAVSRAYISASADCGALARAGLGFYVDSEHGR